MYKSIIEKFKDKKIVILGFGREGKSTYNLIRRYLPDNPLTIVDQNEALLEQNPHLNNDSNLNIIVGTKYLDSLNDYDLIVKSPGIKIPDEITKVVKDKITSQLELMLEVNSQNIIGISGTKGKSTTSSLLYKVINDQNSNCLLLGNIGNPIFDYIDDIKKDTTLIIECSSYQLEFIKKSPHISILVNLFQEHLNYHGSLTNYWEAKLNLFQYQNASDYAIFNSSNDNVRKMMNEHQYESQLVDIDKEINVEDNDVQYKNQTIYHKNDPRHLLGEHNFSNILFVLRTALLLGLDMEKARQSINEFKPLKHRMEYFGTYNGIKFYNDSIATIPEATINCIEAIKDVDTIIFGGLDRGIDYQPLIDYFNNSNIQNFIGLPDTGFKIIDSLRNKRCYKVQDLKQAVAIAMQVTKHTCLLSPAASSYNNFHNFEEKGQVFKDEVINYGK